MVTKYTVEEKLQKLQKRNVLIPELAWIYFLPTDQIMLCFNGVPINIGTGFSVEELEKRCESINAVIFGLLKECYLKQEEKDGGATG